MEYHMILTNISHQIFKNPADFHLSDFVCVHYSHRWHVCLRKFQDFRKCCIQFLLYKRLGTLYMYNFRKFLNIPGNSNESEWHFCYRSLRRMRPKSAAEVYLLFEVEPGFYIMRVVDRIFWFRHIGEVLGVASDENVIWRYLKNWCWYPLPSFWCPLKNTVYIVLSQF